MSKKVLKIEFNYYDELIEFGKKMKIAMIEHRKGQIKLLEKYDVDYSHDENGNLVITHNKIIPSEVFKYQHPLLKKTIKELNIMKNE